MSAAEAGASKLPDATAKLREMRDSYLSIWSKNLIETVNSEGYAKASGAALDSILAVAAPLKEPTEQLMLKTLQQLNMPTSADFASLAGRFTNMELLLDNLDAKLDRIEKLLPSLKASESARQEVPAQPLASEAEVSRSKANVANSTETPMATKVAEFVKTAKPARPVKGTTKATEPVKAAKVAREFAAEKQTAPKVSETSKRPKNVKPVRRNPRKGIR